MLKHDIQLAIVLDTHCRPGKEPKMLVGGPGPKQAKRRRNASSLYAQVAPKFSSVVFAASPLTATKQQIEIGKRGHRRVSR